MAGELPKKENPAELLLKRADPTLFRDLDSPVRTRVANAFATALESKGELRFMAEASFHSGPIPPAAELEKINTVVPNGADRVFKMAEKQQEHRIAIETTVITSQQRQAQTGQIIGAVLVGLLIIAGTVLGLFGQPWVAGTVFGTTIGAVAVVFVLGKKSQDADLEQKREAEKNKRPKIGAE